MGISFKVMNAFSAMEKLGVSPEHLDWLKANPVTAVLKVNGFEFAPESGEVDFKPTTMKISLEHLQQLKAGTISPVEAHKYKLGLESIIVKTIQGDWALQAAFANQTAAVAPESPLAKFPKIKTTPDEPAEPALAASPGGNWPMFDVMKLKSAPTVKLRDATMMYQPVQGTSTGSRYFMVGANKDIRVAARYQGSSLSLRIEGPFWQKYVANIQAVSFDKVQQKEGYASLHVEVPDKLMASKALGAVLVGLNVPLETPIPQLGVIAS